ncbi:glycosyltransferase family 2 protein [Marinomonas posidonica]|uniref:glycosyltransferase family 2 protein n=1 Tax=Marinomonas posidonica TaxID=936476 RepID=UPI0003190EE2|nr:glycosyltransferase family 2 protein [Marinomonas posidonica]
MAESVSHSVEFKPAILIPVYNHEHAIGITLKEVLLYGYPVLLVDDGSSPTCNQVLKQLAQEHAPQNVSLLQLPVNLGKGGAVKAGITELSNQGFSHALQIDADGQHNLSDIPGMIAKSEKHPHAIIAGYPIYDESVPKYRFYARYLTHTWVWINTLSLNIKDSMCGFRVYPTETCRELTSRYSCGNRMDFDTEILVRWVWEGNAVVNQATKVHYPIDGVSHFNKLKDNILISTMHTRLFFGMLRRLPKLLRGKFCG